MSEDLSEVRISLKDIRKTKTLYIEEIGAFTVRKLGAGEGLDLSDKLDRMQELLDELNKIDFSKFDTTTDDGFKEIQKATKKASKLTKELNTIQRDELRMFKSCFTDENDGKNVDMLINSLTPEERSQLFKTIFDTSKVDKKPEEITVYTEPVTKNEPATVDSKDAE